jgi:hypothetical protein
MHTRAFEHFLVGSKRATGIPEGNDLERIKRSYDVLSCLLGLLRPLPLANADATLVLLGRFIYLIA